MLLVLLWLLAITAIALIHPTAQSVPIGTAPIYGKHPAVPFSKIT
jgi:hypothetical protein